MAKQDRNIRLGGFQLNKISAEKNSNFKGKLEIDSNINLKNIEKYKPDIAKQDSLKIEFSFKIDYKELGNINLEGSLFLILDNKTMKEILQGWEKNNIPQELHITLLNIIVQKSSLRAFELEEELGLPLHIRLPRLQPQQNKK
ncbi:MAG: hypothetical protein ACP5D2_00855 [Candidatus Nanoarchaeia archaeon]